MQFHFNKEPHKTIGRYNCAIHFDEYEIKIAFTDHRNPHTIRLIKSLNPHQDGERVYIIGMEQPLVIKLPEPIKRSYEFSPRGDSTFIRQIKALRQQDDVTFIDNLIRATRRPPKQDLKLAQQDLYDRWIKDLLERFKEMISAAEEPEDPKDKRDARLVKHWRELYYNARSAEVDDLYPDDGLPRAIEKVRAILREQDQGFSNLDEYWDESFEDASTLEALEALALQYKLLDPGDDYLGIAVPQDFILARCLIEHVVDALNGISSHELPFTIVGESNHYRRAGALAPNMLDANASIKAAVDDALHAVKLMKRDSALVGELELDEATRAGIDKLLIELGYNNPSRLFYGDRVDVEGLASHIRHLINTLGEHMGNVLCTWGHVDLSHIEVEKMKRAESDEDNHDRYIVTTGKRYSTK